MSWEPAKKVETPKQGKKEKIVFTKRKDVKPLEQVTQEIIGLTTTPIKQNISVKT